MTLFYVIGYFVAWEYRSRAGNLNRCCIGLAQHCCLWSVFFGQKGTKIVLSGEPNIFLNMAMANIINDSVPRRNPTVESRLWCLLAKKNSRQITITLQCFTNFTVNKFEIILDVLTLLRC